MAEAPVILNVDDRESSRYARAQILQQHGFAVVDATTGQEALAAARRLRPAAMLMDVFLPDADGRDIGRTIKQDPELRAIRIVLVSAVVQPLEAAENLDETADAFLAEPISTETLVAALRRVLAS